jgi:serine/threonine-protein kinase
VTIAPGYQIGDVIAGKYRIDQILGAGGMGIVVAAHHLSLDDVVAIKFLSAELGNDADAVSRFDREARAAARIKSEHVARVFDVDRLPSGAPYMVMEHLRGLDLAAVIQRGEPLTEERAVAFVLQACAGLGEAHRVGIVHRDVKPSNLFCVERPDRDYTIKVLDFGISKLTMTSDSSKAVITGTGTALGSPAYMSPEQMRSAADVDARTDVWSLGVVLYELLTGKLPFNGSTYPELCLKIASEAPTPPRRYRPLLSPPLEAVILKCLEKDRALRFATMAEVGQALSRWAPSPAPGAAPLPLVSRPAPAAQVSTLPLVTAEPLASSKSTVTNATWANARSRSEGPKSLIVGGIAGLGLLLVPAVWWLARSDPSVPAPAPSAHVAAAASEPPLPTSHPEPPADGSAPAVAESGGVSAPSANAAKPPPPALPKPSPPPSSSPPVQRSKSAVWSQRD